MDRADIGMIQSRGGTGFATKTLKSLRVLGDPLREKLQGYKSTKRDIFRFVHNAHTAAAEFLKNAVVRYGLADHFDTTSPLARSY